MTIHKKIVTDAEGNPTDVMIPLEEFLEIEEMLGLDLTEQDLQTLKKAQEARRQGKREMFHRLAD